MNVFFVFLGILIISNVDLKPEIKLLVDQGSIHKKLGICTEISRIPGFGIYRIRTDIADSDEKKADSRFQIVDSDFHP